MRRCLFKLGFSTPVHFGGESPQGLEGAEMTCRADTLFAALCSAALTLGGNDALQRLCTLAVNDQLRLSDTMPWQDDTFYLPKPSMTVRVPKRQTGDRKAFKKLQWISLEDYPAYLRTMLNGEGFEARRGYLPFGEVVTQIKGASGRATDEETMPWNVALFEFYHKDDVHRPSGLWFIAEYDSEETAAFLRSLIDALGMSGIGGKVSAGYGKFAVMCQIDPAAADEAALQWLSDALECRTSSLYISLTTALPRDDELDAVLEGAQYQLVRRGGFMMPGAKDVHKKDTHYFLSAGAALPKPFDGALYKAGDQDGHAVYRYGRPVLLGVSL